MGIQIIITLDAGTTDGAPYGVTDRVISDLGWSLVHAMATREKTANQGAENHKPYGYQHPERRIAEDVPF